MKLLPLLIGSELSSLIGGSTDDDQPRRPRSPEVASSPRIMWATEMAGGVKLILVDEHPRQLIEIRSFTDRPETLGNVRIAKRLEELGILREEATEARCALPLEIEEDLPRPEPRQLALEFAPVNRAAG